MTGVQASASSRRRISPNERLNIGVVGVAGRGAENIEGIKDQNIVALCDCDSRNLAGAAKRFPSAHTYVDWRRMLDQKDLDAVLVATPDHTHAVIATNVLRSGRPLYLEKPVTHTIQEARVLSLRLLVPFIDAALRRLSFASPCSPQAAPAPIRSRPADRPGAVAGGVLSER